ncbi:MAG TPA: lipid IV(A) 3-deoxy-D-manno-octulosonic acid transferase [Arenicellales bacterium]|nr:lipid IV(A) 3-deoxy-D-manno-octulosonic acid transferase [Arenicellales bacterium]
MARTVYTLLLSLALPVLLVRLGLRAAKSPAYRARLTERFGGGNGKPRRCDVWIHAVSVGEVNAATPLVRQLLKLTPPSRIVMTTMTPTGAQRVVATFGDRVIHRYAPYDYPFAIDRFLDRFCPKLLVLMETEIWPNMISRCSQRNIPVAMANVRLSARSARGYRLVLPLIRHALDSVSLFATQSLPDRKHLLALGVDALKVYRTGNMKFEIDLPASLNEVAQAIRRDWGPNRPVIVAGSTHEGEESLLLRSLEALLPSFPDLLLVIAPRHPERFEMVTRQATKWGFTVSRRSQQSGALDSTVTVQIADTMGELLTLYGAGDIAVVGGSLIPIRGIGGHNIIEACAVGTPVIFGGNMGNFLEISALALEYQAGYQVKDADALLHCMSLLLEDANLRALVGEHGREMVAQNTGATLKTLELLLPLLTDN